MKNIEINQFWILEDGSIFMITDPPSLCNNLCRGKIITNKEGEFFKNYSCQKGDLNKRTTKNMAKEFALQILLKISKEKINIFFDEKT